MGCQSVIEHADSLDYLARAWLSVLNCPMIIETHASEMQWRD